MHDAEQSVIARSLNSFSGVIAVLAIATGLSVLAGWALDVAVLKSVLPGLVTMKANTALAFVLSGVTLWFIRAGSPIERTPDLGRWLARACAVAVAVIGLATFAQYVSGWDLRIDQVLFRDTGTPGARSPPGRPALATALSFGFLGVALLLKGAEGRGRLEAAQWLATIVFCIGFLAILGYVYGVPALYRVAAYSSMAVHTAVLFALVPIGLVCARPERGWMSRVVEEGPGGLLLRWLLPASLLVPPVLGGLWLQGGRAGLYPAEFGWALFAMSIVLVFATLAWRTALLLGRSDAERREVETRLKVSFQEVSDLKTALDEHALVSITDPQGRITFANDTFCATSKYAREELLGRDHRVINSGHHSQQFMGDLWTTIASGRIWKGEIRNQASDGSYYWVNTTIVPFLDARGKPYQYVSIRTDITERKRQAAALLQTNEALVRSNAELQQFAYAASHDLQTPLRNISGFVKLLQMYYAGRLDARADDWIRRTVQSCEQMRMLIQDLLAYSQLESRSHPFQPVPLRDVVTDLVGVLESNIREVGAEISCGDLPTVLGDRLQLTQLLQNLIENGLKYHGREPPRIQLFAQRGQDEWIVSVRDNGIGIAPQHHERIFEIFKRLHTQQEYPGTGIGLAVGRRVAQRHGGRIWVESAAGAGSTFKFTLPDHAGENP